LIVQTDEPSADVLRQRLDLLDAVEKMHISAVQWSDCDSPAQYRQMRRDGTNGFPKPHVDPKGQTVTIKGRTGEDIELRVLRPDNEDVRGVFLHFHAGWPFYSSEGNLKANTNRRLCYWISA
jgi:acetyl esterase/lipase